MKIFAVTLILMAAIAGVGQSPSPVPAVPKSISGGVLNGKASNLVRPEFPAAARAVRACGAVNVQVKIDTAGNVAEAYAVSGQPLLRSAAVSAAQKSTFAPTLLSGQPVTVTGIIVYNFTCEMTLLEIGFELSGVEYGGTTFRSADAAARLPAEWADERSRVAELDRIISANRRVSIPNKTVATERGNAETGDLLKNQTAIVQEAPADTPSTTPKAAARELIARIESRLANDPESSWSFLIGVGAARLVAVIDDSEAFNAADIDFRSLIDRAPANASKSVIAAARDLLDAARAATEDPAAKEAMLQKATALKSIKYAI